MTHDKLGIKKVERSLALLVLYMISFFIFIACLAYKAYKKVAK